MNLNEGAPRRILAKREDFDTAEQALAMTRYMLCLGGLLTGIRFGFDKDKQEYEIYGSHDKVAIDDLDNVARLFWSAYNAAVNGESDRNFYDESYIRKQAELIASQTGPYVRVLANRTY